MITSPSPSHHLPHLLSLTVTSRLLVGLLLLVQVEGLDNVFVHCAHKRHSITLREGSQKGRINRLIEGHREVRPSAELGTGQWHKFFKVPKERRKRVEACRAGQGRAGQGTTQRSGGEGQANANGDECASKVEEPKDDCRNLGGRLGIVKRWPLPGSLCRAQGQMHRQALKNKKQG